MIVKMRSTQNACALRVLNSRKTDVDQTLAVALVAAKITCVQFEFAIVRLNGPASMQHSFAN